MSVDWNTFLDHAGAVRRDGKVMHFGDPTAEARAALTGDAVVDLGHQALIAVGGADAESFLQGQLSSDVDEVSDARAQPSAWCSPKGRVLACFLVFRHAEHLLLQLPGELADQTLQRMRMFVMRARVTLEDTSDAWPRIGVSGSRIEARIGNELGSLPARAYESLSSKGVTIIRLPGSRPRFEIVGTQQAIGDLWRSSREIAVQAGADAWELLDIQSGIANLDASTVDTFVPQMLNLDRIGAVSFSKGCYVGQEIVARTQHLGRIKRRMFLGHVQGDSAPNPGDSIFDPEDQTRSVGLVVNAQSVPGGGFHMLVVVPIDDTSQSTWSAMPLGDGRSVMLDAPPYPLGDEPA